MNILPFIRPAPRILPQSLADAQFFDWRRTRSTDARVIACFVAVWESSNMMGLVPAINAQTTLRALGFDNDAALIDRCHVRIAIEDEFRTTLPEGAELRWQTVGEACLCVRGLVMKARAWA